MSDGKYLAERAIQRLCNEGYESSAGDIEEFIELLEDRIAELESQVPIREALLRTRVTGLEVEVAEQARLLDMSATREAKLVAEIARLRRLYVDLATD